MPCYYQSRQEETKGSKKLKFFLNETLIFITLSIAYIIEYDSVLIGPIIREKSKSIRYIVISLYLRLSITGLSTHRQ
jgi:hypothetical protein